MEDMRHVAVAVALLRHHEEALAVEAGRDRRVGRHVVVPVDLRIVAGAIGIRRVDRPDLRLDGPAARGRPQQPVLARIAGITVQVHGAPAVPAALHLDPRPRGHGEQPA